MNKRIQQALALLFATNMAIGLAACSGGGCGEQKKKEDAEKTTPMKSPPPFNPNANRGGVPGAPQGDTYQPGAVKTGVSGLSNKVPKSGAPETTKSEGAPEAEE